MMDEKPVKVAKSEPKPPSAVELLEQAAAALDGYSGDRVKRAAGLAAQVRELAAKVAAL